jgi:CheY-like chemotaxis protein
VERGPFDLDAMLRDLAAMFSLRARTKGLVFEVEAPPGGPHVLLGDEGKVRQVLVNLLGNAVKFTDRGHVRLTVRLRPVPGPGPERGQHLRVEVADTGPGLAEEELARLFREFEQAAAGRALQSGTGLGLAISRAFARLMGGDLTVESAPGRGATFTFEVPVEASSVPAPARLARRVAGIEGADHPPRALVVDDEAANRDWLAQTLQAVGFEVREAADGAEAVAACEGGWPEVVLMDLRMPGMDGLEATRRLRARPGGEGVAVVAITASALEEERAAFQAAGADAVLAKPVREAELLEVVGRRLGLTWRYEGEAAAPAAAAAPLGPEALAGMPAALLDGMREATRRGDIDRLNELIDEAGASSAAAAAGLRALAERYDYEALNRALA